MNTELNNEKVAEGKIYNIIDSVKGGCGKTTFGIMLSLLLDKYRTEKKNNGETVACMVDVDIQGSALLYLLFGKTYIDRETDNNFKFLNDRVIAVGQTEGSSMEYVHRFTFKAPEKAQSEEKETKEGDSPKVAEDRRPWFDVVFCDPRSEGKKKFRSLSNQNYSPEVLYSTYRMGMASMVANLKRQKEYQHRYIVFDMPPNSDGYSDSVYDILLKKEYTIMEEKDVCNLFLIQTVDYGQRQATLEYLKELSTTENFKKINKIFLVFNDWLNYRSGDSLFEDAISHMKSELKNIDEKLYKKIFFIGLNFNEKYYRLCTQNDGIRNQEMPEGLMEPINYIKNIEGEDLILILKKENGEVVTDVEMTQAEKFIRVLEKKSSEE